MSRTIDKILRLVPLEYVIQRAKRKIFHSIAKNSKDVFVRGKDIGGVRPQIFGVHEEYLTRLIERMAKDGNSDFFLDIGANVEL